MEQLFFISKNKSHARIVQKMDDGKLNIMSLNGEPMKDAGLFIVSCGGIDKLLSKCVNEQEFEQHKIRLSKEKEERENRNIELSKKIAKIRAEEDLKIKLMLENQPIQANEDNIRLIARYLNAHNWGSWNLPKLNISYKANQYNCNGKIATTIVLNEPIEFYGEMESKFVYNAPNGHLNQYQRL